MSPNGHRGGTPLRAPTADELVDGLADTDPAVRAASARACGTGLLEGAVPMLSERLIDPDPSVRSAAAGALGRIGGARSAEALLRALRMRQLGAGRLARELARSAPDFFLETALLRPENRHVRATLALAAGLRGRSTVVAEQLLTLLQGDSAERAGACHALGALRHSPAEPSLKNALHDPDPRVRQAAGIALARLGAVPPRRRAKGEELGRQPRPRGHLLDHLRIWRRNR
jgi:HEAT repeat protein